MKLNYFSVFNTFLGNYQLVIFTRLQRGRVKTYHQDNFHL